MFDLDPILLLPLALVLALMALPVVSRRIHGPVDYVQPGELHQWIGADQGLDILDLRKARDFAERHIPGALHVDERDLSTTVPRLRSAAENGWPLVLVCDSDTRSIRAAARIRKNTNLRPLVLKGGMFKWKRMKLPVVVS